MVKTQKQTKIKNPVNINFAISIGKEVIGGIGFSHIDKHKAEIGYWLSKKHREKGIMTEAVKLTAKFGFGKLKLKRIYAYVFLFNKASKRVLEKAGYKLEGTLRKYAKKGNKFMDVLLFAKTK